MVREVDEPVAHRIDGPAGCNQQGAPRIIYPAL